MDAPALLRRVVATYLLSLGVLGAGTVVWAMNGLLVDNPMPLARFWFLLAGFGTVLTAVMLWGYFTGEPVLSSSPGRSSDLRGIQHRGQHRNQRRGQRRGQHRDSRRSRLRDRCRGQSLGSRRSPPRP